MKLIDIRTLKNKNEICHSLQNNFCTEMLDLMAIDICKNDDDENKISFDFGVENQLDCLTFIKNIYIDAVKPLNFPDKQQMKINLTSDTPFYCSPRRLYFYETEEVNKMVKELIDSAIVRPSSSPYASPIVLVKKKSGKLKMCVDYRGLNKLTERDNYPLPLIEDCIEYLERKKIFSLLDLKNGFHQVKMNDESIKYTSFITPNGQYEYLRMPFGLKNGPSVFQ